MRGLRQGVVPELRHAFYDSDLSRMQRGAAPQRTARVYRAVAAVRPALRDRVQFGVHGAGSPLRGLYADERLRRLEVHQPILPVRLRLVLRRGDFLVFPHQGRPLDADRLLRDTRLSGVLHLADLAVGVLRSDPGRRRSIAEEASGRFRGGLCG